jgi:type II secretory ATPase GspE/PulE/Tfp pilus assembly ATPase PilB-like protein
LKLRNQISQEKKEIIRSLTKISSWLVLTAWPTGSWKTTMLYAMLWLINPFERSIMTVEDPVENKIYWVVHCSIDNAKWFTFAKAAKELVRQQPKVILLWEIRDPETAEYAVYFWQSWHLVLSTTHADNVAKTAMKLASLNMSYTDLLSALKWIISLRVVPKLCPHCKVKATWLSQDMMLKLKQYPFLTKDIQAIKTAWWSIYKRNHKWCDKCMNWVKSVTTLAEVYVVDDVYEKLLLEWKSAWEIEKYFLALRQNWQFRSFQDEAILKLFSWIVDENDVLLYV